MCWLGVEVQRLEHIELPGLDPRGPKEDVFYTWLCILEYVFYLLLQMRVFWPGGGLNRVAPAEISRIQVLLCQTEPPGFETYQISLFGHARKNVSCLGDVHPNGFPGVNPFLKLRPNEA